MEKKPKRESVKLVIENLDGEIYAHTNRGIEWIFPQNMSHSVILSALVYGALMNKMESVSEDASSYRISIETTIINEK